MDHRWLNDYRENGLDWWSRFGFVTTVYGSGNATQPPAPTPLAAIDPKLRLSAGVVYPRPAGSAVQRAYKLIDDANI